MNRRPKGVPRSNGRRVPPVGMHRAFEPAEAEAKEAEQEGQRHRRKTLSFEVPLPPKILSKNWPDGSRLHKAEPTRHYRQEVSYACRMEMMRVGWLEPRRAVLNLTFGTAHVSPDARKLEQLKPSHLQPYRPRDVMNAISAFHAGADGITDAGAWVDDSHRYVSLGRVQIDPSLPAGVRVFIQER